ncbi:two-partner secretion domain-containing protein [Coleofasciculus chthonoplastes]|uniref:two-partner secretion domain-containing protein n=1 Tax=Coleofasciculus chthonoplastes TaxID=64178 RepID=UPI001E48EE9F|nr:filamentous hemagglutinin N-terminal domain-containing protein [Coleofasciculus chthonoplastes]
MPTNCQIKLAGWLAIGGIMAGLETPVVAQITPDTTLDAEQSIVTPNVDIKGLPADLIEGGAIRNTNLFHSFIEFNVGEGGRVYFANPAGIETIFSRVTGNDISDILGTLGVNGQASLYLLNPNGIIFGEGARLDVAGSFVGTTADAVVFENGLTFSATNPEAPPLLTINVTPGLQYGNNQPDASIRNSGYLNVGQDLRLAAQTLNLEGQLQAGRDISLIAADTVMMQETISNPFIAAAGNQLEVEGANYLTISALNHPDSGLFSGGDLVLRSDNPIKGNAHYTTGGSFRIEDLAGNLGQLTSLEDPVIRASGDVILGGYVGASLHILAGGSVTIPGDVVIQSADPVNGIVENITLSDGTTILVDGKTQPTLDIRAGTTAFDIPDIQGIPATGIIVPPLPNPVGIPTSADMTIGGIFFNAPDGVALITNQYQPNLSLPGGEIIINGVSGVAISPNPDNPAATISSITIDSRDRMTVNGAINASSQVGNGGNITLIGGGDIVTSDIFSLGALGGKIQLSSQGAIALNGLLNPSGLTRSGDIFLEAKDNITTSQILSVGGLAGMINLRSNGTILVNDHLISSISITQEPGTSGGDIIIDAKSLSLTNSARIVTATLGAANGGDFQVTTADSVEFKGLSSNPVNQDVFRALLAGLDSLPENISAPIAAALNSTENPALAQISGSGLYALTVIGTGNAGNIDIETGRLFSQELGRVTTNTIGQGDSGNLTINADLVEVIGSSSPDNAGGLFSQTNGLGDAGNLTINTDKLIIRNGGLVSASTILSSGDGGVVTVNAAESIDIIGTTPEGNFPSAIGNIARGTGDAGNIFVNTQRLMIRDGGAIGTTTFSQGDGGDLTVNASESIDIIGKAAVGEIPSAISVDTFSLSPDAGDAGNLLVNTRQLRIEDGAFISASTFGAGQGGNLQVNATEAINLMGRSIDGFPSGLYAQGFGTGNAGDLEVKTDQLRVEDGARITVATGTIADDTQLIANSLSFGLGLEVEFSDQATGNAGTMWIDANSIQLDNQGSLIARTISGEGGNINLQAEDLIEMRRNSLISAEALGGQGNGGNITIDTEFIVAIEDENSDIVADAFGGDGGNINITAQNIFGLEFRPQRTPKSDITASSRFGLDGTVEINSPDVDPSRELNQLPTKPIDVQGLVGQVCQADAGLNQSSFVVTGRGGLPPKPNELLRGEAVFADWISLESPENNSDNPNNTATMPDNPTQPRQIVEAKGWIIDEQGNVILTAEATDATSANPPVYPHFCE